MLGLSSTLCAYHVIQKVNKDQRVGRPGSGARIKLTDCFTEQLKKRYAVEQTDFIDARIAFLHHQVSCSLLNHKLFGMNYLVAVYNS